VRRGDRVLDVAAGTGNSAVAAAQLGASVVASDLTPELLEAGRRRPEAVGLDLQWHHDDAEALSFGDGEFDVVLSCIGVMFAPHHQRAADELLRVCRPGGRLGILSWTPAGFVGQLFATMKPFAPAPPPGSQPAPLWGSADHVRGLLGDRVSDVVTSTETLRVELFATPEVFGDYFKTHYGPTVAVYRSLADRPDDVSALDAALADLARRHAVPASPSLVMEWEYLILTATVQR
jgi:SAM-dependent methyltransferase